MDELVRLICKNGYIFGGYVRDLLCGDSPSDIDCVIRSEKQFLCFEQELVNTFGPFTTIRVGGYEDLDGYDLNLRRLLVGEKSIQVDVIDRQPFLDFDVNSLMLSKNGIFVSYCHQNSFNSVVHNIMNKRAKIYSYDVPEHRIEKMKKKGWEIIGTDVLINF